MGSHRLALAGCHTCAGMTRGRKRQVLPSGLAQHRAHYGRLYFTSKARKALSAIGFWGLRVSHSSTTFRAVSRSPIFT